MLNKPSGSTEVKGSTCHHKLYVNQAYKTLINVHLFKKRTCHFKNEKKKYGIVISISVQLLKLKNIYL